MLGLAMLVVCSAVKATPNENDKDNLTKTHAVNTFVAAMTQGKLAGLCGPGPFFYQ